jgi:hypothetical protein
MTTALRSNQVQDELERSVPGATVYVYNQADGSLAALTSDGTTSIGNPLTTDAFGNYSYYALVGYYREDIWFNGSKRWSENNVAVGSPGADLALRSDLATTSDPTRGSGLLGFNHFTSYVSGTLGYAVMQANVTLTGTDQYTSFNETSPQQGRRIYMDASMVNQAGASLNHLNAVALTAAIDTGKSASNRGSTISHGSRNIIHNADDGSGYLSGSNREYTVSLNILRARATGGSGGPYANKWGNYWLTDWSVVGPAYGTDTTSREQFMGSVMFIRKQTQGTATGTDAEGVGKAFWGSVGLAIHTNAQSRGGGDFGTEDSLATYTANAGLDVTGWAGPWGTLNGSSVGAIEAFTYGVKVGGQPYCPWSPLGVRSKVGTGVYVQDCTGYGINIENLYSGASGLARFAGTLATHIVNPQGLMQLVEVAAASVTNPPSGSQVLFIDTADHKLKRKDSSGTVTIIA